MSTRNRKHGGAVRTMLLIFTIAAFGGREMFQDVKSSLENGFAEQEIERLGDNCLFVYLDVGANIGVHTRFLFEPHLYPQAKPVLDLFGSVFGEHRENLDYCSFGFEPNSAHKTRNENLEKAYAKKGWRYKYIHGAASDVDGNKTFWHHMEGIDKDREEWGFSHAKWNNSDVSEVVPLIHLSKWIQYHIVERKLPTTTYGDYEGSPRNGKVVMKMDIEGAEYAVLPSLMFSGIFCSAFDVVFGEKHPHFYTAVNEFVKNRPEERQLLFESREEAAGWFDFLVFNVSRLLHQDNCKATWVDLDCEEYLHDEVALP